MLVWLAMVTGVRRGELCALRRSHLDPVAGILRVLASVSGPRGRIREKDMKTHQQRWVALDPGTLKLLAEHMAA
jgi:integrase